MTTQITYSLCLSAALLFSACTTAPTDSPSQEVFSQPGRASQYRTFAIAPLPTHGPSTDPGAPIRLNEVTRSTIVETLTAKGFRETAADAADFIVKVETEYSQDPIFESSEKRHGTIAFHDRISDQVIWSAQRGRSSARTLEPDLLRKTLIDMLAPVPTVPSN